MFLLFDLSVHDVIHLAQFDESSVIHESVAGGNRDLLAAVVDFVAEKRMTLNDIQGVASVVGSGSFTSTRIAAVVANIFGYVRRIPLIAVSKNDAVDPRHLASQFQTIKERHYISPTYSSEPNLGRQRT